MGKSFLANTDIKDVSVHVFVSPFTLTGRFFYYFKIKNAKYA